MDVKVVDASAVAAILFGEPDAETMAQKMADARRVAPGLLGFELANVCLVKCKRHPAQRDALLAAFALRDQLRIEEMRVDIGDVLDLARATGLTAYDASYLWLSRHLGAELITLDRKLAAAASASA